MKNPYLYIAILLAVGAALLVWSFSLDPRGKPVAGHEDGAALILSGRDLRAPDPSPEQSHSIANGHLSLSVLPNQPPPTPAERGVRILLASARTAHVNDRSVIVEVRYSVASANPASGLAVSLQGIGPSEWVSQTLSAEAGTARFELPPQNLVDSIGLRALSDTPNQPGALNITEIRVSPAPETAEP